MTLSDTPEPGPDSGPDRGLNLDLLRRLSEAAAPSGEEREVAVLLKQRFADLGLPVQVDRAGNVIATVRGTTPGTPTVAVLSHMDEVGLVVRRVERDGFLRVTRIGGIGRRSLAARPIMLLGADGKVPGLVGVKAHHLTDPAEVQQLPGVDAVYVDVGAASADEVRDLGVDIGTKAVYDAPFRRLAGTRVGGKAMDNRALCLALVHLAERLVAEPPAGDVLLIGSVREEFNLKGSVMAVGVLKPDIALVLDVTPATDTPDLAGIGDIRLGSGPAVKHFDFHGRGPLSGYIAPPGLAQALHRMADGLGIATQREAIIGLVTDAAEMATLPGAPVVACLAVPTRYTHSPVELLDLGDLADLVRLAERAVRDLPADEATLAPPW